MRIKNKIFVVILMSAILALSCLLTACSSGEVRFVKIEMAQLPTVTEYTIGDTFSPAGGKINVVSSDLSKTQLELTDSDVTLSVPDMNKVGKKRVYVSYGGDRTSFGITVSEQAALPIVTEMSLGTVPEKTQYTLGEQFSAAGGTINATYEDGTSATVPMTDGNITLSGYDMNIIGPQTVTVTYGGRTVTFDITVDFSQAPSASVSSVVVKKLPALTEYEAGETFSAAGGVITVTYGDNTVVDISMLYGGVTISGANTATEGTKTVTVSFGGQSATFEITVLPSGSTVPSEGVTRVTWAQRPDTSVEYFENDEFDVSAIGGLITVTYNDGTSMTVPITQRGVTISTVDMSTAGSKTVTVGVGNRTVNFTITVLKLGGTVTYNVNYDGGTSEQVRYAVTRTITNRAEDPVRGGYTFRGWYSDSACTVIYEFGREVISGDKSVYASWTSDASASYKVTYDLNYYGVRVQTYTQYVQAGDSARRITDASLNNPTRSEFTFDGWFGAASGGAQYNFDSAINADTTIYAHWTKTKTGSSEYTFEAENVNLEGMEGPGASGSNAGAEMIVEDTGKGASGGKFVSYLYKEGLTLNFYIASDSEDNNATIAFYIGAELGAPIYLNPDTYQLKVNGTNLEYPQLTLTVENHGTIGAYIVISGVHIVAGMNHIEMVTNNDINPFGQGVGTYAGSAPIVDCIKITTTAVLMWDETKGLPANV